MRDQLTGGAWNVNPGIEGVIGGRPLVRCGDKGFEIEKAWDGRESVPGGARPVDEAEGFVAAVD